MKVFGFSPWQQVNTSIPAVSNSDCLATEYCFVANLPTKKDLHPTPKRTRSSGGYINESKKTKNDLIQPDLVLTSPHQISTLGHNADKSSKIDEVSDWVYNSRPGSSSSFIPYSVPSNGIKSVKPNKRIPAVIDSSCRAIFALQNNNCTLSVWSLDADINGPDEACHAKKVQKVVFNSPVSCMDPLPPRRHGINSKIGNKYDGGVAGLLMNGQMFVVIIPRTNGKKPGEESVSVGIFDNNSNLNNAPVRHLFSCVKEVRLSSSGNKVLKKNVKGPNKRKRHSIDPSALCDNEEICITLTTLSMNEDKNSCIVSNHSVEVSSLSSIEIVPEKEMTYTQMKASYSLRLEEVKLSKDLVRFAEGDEQCVHVAQLDTNHISIVYKATKSGKGSEWLCVILNFQIGKFITKPFPLFTKLSQSVLEVGGLSDKTIVVLTSENVLAVYDVYQALVLYNVNVQAIMPHEKESSIVQKEKHNFGFVTQFRTGMICLIDKQHSVKGQAASVRFSQFGLFGANDFSCNNKSNLAALISSSITTTHTEKSLIWHNPDVVGRGVDQLYPFHTHEIIRKNVFLESKMKSIITSKIKELNLCSICEDETDSKDKILLSAFKECYNASIHYNIYNRKGKKTKNSQSKVDQKIPHYLVDATVPVLIKVIITRNIKESEKVKAVNLLIQYIKRCMVSARVHFGNVTTIRKSDGVDILRNLLFSTRAMSNQKDTVITDLPLSLVCHLLRFCAGTISEGMLVVMAHYILCHATPLELQEHWEKIGPNDLWYEDEAIERLESYVDSDANMEQASYSRLFTARQLFLIGKVVSHTHCNEALLRAALKRGLTQSDKGEVEVLLQMLSKLLQRSTGNPIMMMSILQWLSTVTDANISKLLKRSSCTSGAIKQMKKSVSNAISQGEAVLALKGLFDYVDKSLVKESKNNLGNEVLCGPIPSYGIESLIF